MSDIPRFQGLTETDLLLVEEALNTAGNDYEDLGNQEQADRLYALANIVAEEHNSRQTGAPAQQPPTN